jgi:hypothetical protein
VEQFSQTVNSLLQLLIQLGDLIVAGLKSIELWLRGQLAALGVPVELQTLIMLALAALLIMGVVRLFGGLIRIVVVLVLLLVAARVLLPVLPH